MVNKLANFTTFYYIIITESQRLISSSECEMKIIVVDFIFLLRLLKIVFACSKFRLQKASSSINISGLCKIARTIPSLCFCPNDKESPFSLIVASRPNGIE